MNTNQYSCEDNSMKKIIVSFVQKTLNDQRGQILPWLAVVLVGMLGMAGLSMDLGRAYIVRSQLQNVANAAALAAAGEVYSSSSTSNASTIAASYSSGSGDENANSTLSGVTPSVTTVCLNMLEPTGETCGSSSPANAVRIKEAASIPTYFMKLLGFNTLNVSATATASMQGLAQGWNVAIIVDGTDSMGTVDSNCGGLTEFECALSGVQAFLAATNPCAGGVSSCTPSSNSLLRVSLFSFPNLSTTSGFSDNNTCAGPFTNEVYTLPTTSTTTYSPIQYTGTSAVTATYQLANWDTGYYKPSDSTTYGLNSSDNLVEAIGYGYNAKTGSMAHKGCLPNVGGESTYYGGVIYAAQAALLEAQKQYGGQNAMILLSDGQANAASSKFPQKTSNATNTTLAISVTSAGSTSAGSSSYNLTGVAGTYGLYPDFVDECQQAIQAAQSATAAGTRVYAVAYGAEDNGCGVSGEGATVTDTTLVATGNNASFTLSSLLPCVTMENIASSLQYFYSDAQQSGSNVDQACVANSNSVSTLQDIFLAISSTFTTPRLLPNNAQ
jgi:Flp pilus assembly protein TadG